MNSSPSEQTLHDGLIDFSKYSTDQLNDLQYSIDRNTFPLNYRNLLAALEKRTPLTERDQASDNRWPVQFTRRSGLQGWLEALGRRQQVYGDGWIEIGGDEIVLHGWQRTWLGMPMQATIGASTDTIRNVGQDGNLVTLEYGRRHRRVMFRMQSPETAHQIVGRLPSARMAGFDEKWADLQRFQRSLDAAGTNAWVTVAIVIANALMFVALAIREKRTSNFDLGQLLDWGANFGPLTVNGQWWRLASAEFLHLDPAHLLINMWALWNIGRLTERLYGRWTYLILYLATALLASLTSIVWDPTRVSAGASGAIFGMFGAFLAYLVHRRTHVPISIIRSHWFSTLAFVLFSLVSGALQTGIDNAAHVGGFLSGLAIGWFLARPLEPTGRARMLPRQAFAAAAIFVVLATIGIAQARGAGSQLTELEKYWQAHDWYRRGEADNLRLWQSIAARGAAGTISNLETGYQFETNILPFWNNARQRLEKDDSALTGKQKRYAEMLLDYVKTRHDWAEAVVSANKERDGKTTSDIQALARKTDGILARFERIQLRESMSHRPSALSNSTLVAFVRNRLLTSGQACVREPAFFGKNVSATDSKTDTPALADAIGCAAQHAFDTDDFSALEAMVAKYSKTLDDLPDGSSSLSAMMNGLGDLFEYGNRNVLSDLGRTADWRRSHPDSITPDLVDAVLFHSWAWSARGSGTADTISPQMDAFYRYRTEMAAAALEDMKERAAGSPIWYQLSIDVGLDQSIGLDRLRAIFDARNARFPEFLPLYRHMIRVMLPRWEGSYDDIDKFVSHIDENARSRVGPEMYARLYWMFGTMEEDRANIFDVTDVRWVLMKAGFHGLLKRYPKSDYLVNAFANLACQADAVTEYEELRPVVSKRLSATAWSDHISLASCDDKFKEALKSDHVHF